MLSGERASPHTAAKLTFLSRISETLFKIEIWIRGVSDTETLRLWDAKILKHWDSELFRLWNAESFRCWVCEILRLWDIKDLKYVVLLWDSTILKFWDTEVLDKKWILATVWRAGGRTGRWHHPATKDFEKLGMQYRAGCFPFLPAADYHAIRKYCKAAKKERSHEFPLMTAPCRYLELLSQSFLSHVNSGQQQRNLSLSSNSPTATDALQSKNPSSSSYLSL